MGNPVVPETDPLPVPHVSKASTTGWRSWLPDDPYTIAGWAMFFAIVVICWTGFVVNDEELYFLGSRRIADPSLLAHDFTWTRLPPTSALFDHLVAPLWRFFDDFTVANLGRLVTWGLLVWSITFAARPMKLPAWSVFVGFTLWLLWRQTLVICGSPIEGFQVKSFGYPFIFFALGFALRGQVARAGMAAGLGTAFHLVVGGWGCFAVFVSMLVNRKLFTFRQLGIYLLSAAPFILPLLIAVTRFHHGHVTPSEQARMDEIYVRFAMPHCCDPNYFMSLMKKPLAWLRSTVVFAIALIVVFAWPERRAARVVGTFTCVVILLFFCGVIADRLNFYPLLIVFPFQLATALPALFLFMFVTGLIGTRELTRRLGNLVGTLVVAGTLWLGYDREMLDQLWEQPGYFVSSVQDVLEVGPAGEPLDSMYVWIKKDTPRNAVFITPLIPEFWPYSDRAQVASMRHPPLDKRLLEWKERLEAMNGFRPFVLRGFDVEKEMFVNEAHLTIPQLIRIRDLYGATHYMIQGTRPDLAGHWLHSDVGYSVYDVMGMKPEEAAESTAVRAATAAAAR